MNFLQLPNRTIKKIVQRMQLKCSCGWDRAVGDIHHIIPRSKGGSDELTNLSYLCPNCHREIHSGLDVKLIPLSDLIGNEWLKFYHPEKAGLKQKLKEKKASQKKELQRRVVDSTINFSEYGWATKVAPIIGITPQKVSKWMKTNLPQFYEECCFKRSNRNNMEL